MNYIKGPLFYFLFAAYVLLLSPQTISRTLSLDSNEFQLFKSARIKVNGYSDILLNLKEGNRVKFSDGKVFTIKKIISDTGLSFLFENELGDVVRIPNRMSGIYTNEQMLVGHAKLIKLNVPIIKIKTELSSRHAEYIIAEKINSPQTLDEVLKHWNKIRKIDNSDQARGLLEFSEKMSVLTHIDDFSGDQVLWDGDRWILHDWLGAVEVALTEDDPFLLNNSSIRAPKYIQDEIFRMQRIKRNRIFEPIDDPPCRKALLRALDRLLEE